MRAISNSFGLAELPPEEYSPATCELLMDLLRNRLHCVATKAELTGLLVGALVLPCSVPVLGVRALRGGPRAERGL